MIKVISFFITIDFQYTVPLSGPSTKYSLRDDVFYFCFISFGAISIKALLHTFSVV